jgi:hypothetical protein
LDLIEAEILSGDANFGLTHVQDSNKKIWSILVCRKLGVFVTLVINNIIFSTPGSRCRYGSSNHNQICQWVEGFVKVSLSNPDYKRTGRLDKGQGYFFVITGMNPKQINFCLLCDDMCSGMGIIGGCFGLQLLPQRSMCHEKIGMFICFPYVLNLHLRCTLIESSCNRVNGWNSGQILTLWTFRVWPRYSSSRWGEATVISMLLALSPP